MKNEKNGSGDRFSGSVFLLGFLSVVCCLNQSSSKNTVYRGRTRES